MSSFSVLAICTGVMWVSIRFFHAISVLIMKGHQKFYRYDVYSEEEVERMTFSDIEEDVVAKFCVEDCVRLYQKHLLGCCSASLIHDTGKKHFLSSMKRGL